MDLFDSIPKQESNNQNDLDSTEFPEARALEKLVQKGNARKVANYLMGLGKSEMIEALLYCGFSIISGNKKVILEYAMPHIIEACIKKKTPLNVAI